MIYFIQPVGLQTVVKIGFTSSSPFGRLCNLQTSHYLELQIVMVIEGDKEFEKKLHWKFSEYRIRGEWFRREGKLDEFILQNFAKRILTYG
jgi:hypothetical protein